MQNINALLCVTIPIWFFFPWCVAGGFPGAAGDTVTLKEGENLKLHCTFSSLSSTNSTLQWLNPKGFTIFLNALQGKCETPAWGHFPPGLGTLSWPCCHPGQVTLGVGAGSGSVQRILWRLLSLHGHQKLMGLGSPENRGQATFRE